MPRVMNRMLFAVALAFTLSPALVCTSAEALQILELKSPQSFLVDPVTHAYFISNVNGDPAEKDNNGFITKLDKDGTLVNLGFVRGSRGDAVLHAPKGLAVVGHVLYVADIDTVRGFNTETGRPVVTVPISTGQSRSPSTGLIDVVYDGKDHLFVSDVETNTIYQVDIANRHAVSVFVKDEALAGPRGLAIHPSTGHLIAVSWNEGSVLDISPEGTITVLVSNSFFSRRFKNLDGVDFDTWGSMYISDMTAGKVWRVTPDQQFDVIAEYLPTPAGISIDRTNHLILVPFLHSDAAEINGLEVPVQAKRKKRKRTLADYGFPFMKSAPERKAPEDE
jgi:hypothetical protein